MTLYYLAYGSNLHPIRLTERIASTKLVGTATLPGYQLFFHKRGQDSSGKCNILQTNNESHAVHTAIFSIDSEHKAILDQFEGPGYESREITVVCDDKELNCFAYFANDSHIEDDIAPYHWYKEIVELGAKYHNFPSKYITKIASINSKQDPDEIRREKHEKLIATM